MDRNKIIQFCEDYLKVKDFTDFCSNGLQVEGEAEIKKIITGVTLSQKLIEQAIAKKAQMIIVHHGLFKSFFDGWQIKGVNKNRLKMILENNINLAGFHLPLDAHSEIGNNISICRLLGVEENITKFDVGFIGELKKEINFQEFVRLVEDKLACKTYSIPAGSKNSKKIAIISGGASPDYKQAAELGADTFICGDIREEVVRGVEEIGLNFINAGHYNTEKLGVKNLGELLAKEFNLEVEFVDIPNEI